MYNECTSKGGIIMTKKDELLEKVNASAKFLQEGSRAYLLSLINQEARVLTSDYNYSEREILLDATKIYPEVATYNINCDLKNVFKSIMATDGELQTILVEDPNLLQFVANYKKAYYPYC